MPQEFQVDVVRNIDRIFPGMDNVLENKKDIEEAIDGIGVGFEIAALVANTEAVDDVQLLMGYFIGVRKGYVTDHKSLSTSIN